LKHAVAIGEGLSKLSMILSGGPSISLFDMLLATGGVQELDVPFVFCPFGCFALLGGSFVFLDMDPSILFFVFLFF
jgi:hypothetical protein